MGLKNNVLAEIEKHVILTPEKPAIITSNNVISYSSLNLFSNKIANFIISQGLAGSNIGIMLKRTPEIIITILGVLKAGCTYIFLDPKYPVQRLLYILENSRS